MYLAKKLISLVLLPLPVALILIASGCVLLLLGRRPRFSRALVVAGCAVLLVFSSSPVAHRLTVPLDYHYQPLFSPPPGVRFVVVLAGGYDPDPGLTVTSQLGATTIERTVEGIRLYRMLPGAKLVVSGGTLHGYSRSLASVMAGMAESIGVPGQDIVLEDKSLDTEQEARFMVPIVGREPLVLVTSATHMVRAMRLFQRAGMTPVPAPLGPSTQPPAVFRYFPSTDALEKSDGAIHEYLGLLWNRLRGAG